jgi:putative SOS response-associated peptidase YedK
MTPIHDRMPVILAPEDYSRWLDPDVRDPEKLASMLRPYPSEAMVAQAVSTYVNSPSREGPQCIAPVE